MENTTRTADDISPPPYAAVEQNLTHPIQPIPYQQSYGTRVLYAQPNHTEALELASIQDYMGWSIFNLLCCCFPFGIISIILSSQIRDRKMLRDVRGARKLSSKTAGWNMFTTFAGIALSVGIWIYLSRARSSN